VNISSGSLASGRAPNRFITLASRLVNSRRASFTDKALFGASIGAWAQAAMRGPSAWSVGERELMAAMVARWNACSFCADVHAAAAAKHMGWPVVRSALADYRTAQISEGLRLTLAYLEAMILRSEMLTEKDADAVLASGISAESLFDAISIGTMFNLVARYVTALDFSAPIPTELHRLSETLLEGGYRLQAPDLEGARTGSPRVGRRVPLRAAR
jgi:uncharacterized peroxidase-related enzyme